METTEKIVEAYVRYVRKCATIPNIRCDDQHEIDLLAIHPRTLERYHIETSVSISPGFSKLTANVFDPERAKERIHKPTMRRTLGYFIERKFSPKAVMERLHEYGFEPGNYQSCGVWSWTPEAKEKADEAKIELWDFNNKIVKEIADQMRDAHSYFTDDTLRTINLFVRASPDKPDLT